MEYVNPIVLKRDIKSALVVYLTRNVVGPLESALGQCPPGMLVAPVLVHRVDPETFRNVVSTRMTAQQVIGRVLYDDTIINALVGENQNNIYKISGVRVKRVGMSGLEISVKISHSPTLDRYLSGIVPPIGAVVHSDGYLRWDIPLQGRGLDAVMEIASSLCDALIIYTKLSTRLPQCNDFQSSLPRFGNS